MWNSGDVLIEELSLSFPSNVKRPFKQVLNLIFLILLKIFMSQTAQQTLELEKLKKNKKTAKQL